MASAYRLNHFKQRSSRDWELYWPELSSIWHLVFEEVGEALDQSENSRNGLG